MSESTSWRHGRGRLTLPRLRRKYPERDNNRGKPCRVCKKTKWAASWQNQQNGCAPSEDSDQPGNLPSLIRIVAVHMKKAWVLSYPLSAQRRLWSDWADAQADLSLRWAHIPFCWFCHVVAQIKMDNRIHLRDKSQKHKRNNSRTVKIIEFRTSENLL